MLTGNRPGTTYAFATFALQDGGSLRDSARVTVRRSVRSSSDQRGPQLAGVVDHVHEHVVPRWAGDTNFMPVMGDVRVMPQHLDETYALLRPGFQA